MTVARGVHRTPSRITGRSGPDRHRSLKGVASRIALPFFVLLLSASIAGAQCNPGQDFSYTGDVQQFTVPAGVTAVRITAHGAQGGSFGNSTGGNGGTAEGTLAVTPGEVLQIRVGGRNGYNGGGAGGTNPGDATYGGATGGGATDIRQGGSGEVNRVLVAGGGGGAGGGDGSGGDPCANQTGGAGGYPGGSGGMASGLAYSTGGTGGANGGSGGLGDCVDGDCTCSPGGGGGGGQNGGGGGGAYTTTAGGSGGACGSNGDDGIGGAESAGDGGCFGAGGAGGTERGGGGGGGGWYGGGAGGGNWSAGGGGGSSYIGGVTDPLTSNGDWTGDGFVSICWAADVPAGPNGFLPLLGALLAAAGIVALRRRLARG